MTTPARRRARPATPVASGKPEGWTCPVCGRCFARRVAEHACGRFELESHFEGKDRRIRAMFDRLLKLVGAGRRGGEGVTITPLKTMITLSAPTIFGGAIARRESLRVTLVLPRQAEHGACVGRRPWGTAKVWHEFVFRDVPELDADFAALVREAHTEARESA